MSLPCDIIFEILLRLRVKTLFRFQCVSKSWKAIISDPVFRKAHRCRAEQNPLIFAVRDFHYPDPKIIQLQSWDKRGTLINEFVESRLKKSYGYSWRVRTCLDLVCVHNCYNAAIFCNLATEESIVLPLLNSPAGCPAKRNRKKRKKSPERQTLAVEFGYVSSTEEFKVLHIFDTLWSDSDRNKHRCCEVFTLCVDNQWRAAPALPSLVYEIDKDYIAFANGAIHFMPIHEPEDVGIAAFDLEREEWSMIPFPPVLYSEDLCLDLFNLGGLLCALKHPDGDEGFDIWLLKDYQKGVWVKEYIIDLSALNYNVHSIDVLPLAIEQDGRILIQVSGFGLCWLHYYDPKGKNYEEIKAPEHWSRTRLYFEGFSSLGSR